MWIRGISIAVLLPAILIAVQALPVHAEQSVLTADPPPAPDPGLASEIEGEVLEGPDLELGLEDDAPEPVRREPRSNPIRSQPAEVDEVEADRVEAEVDDFEPNRVESEYPVRPELEPTPHWDNPGGSMYGGECGGCPTQCGNCAICCTPCGKPHVLWVRPEYLLWWTKGMDIPPLVTTSTDPDIPVDRAGVLGDPTTVILYGGDDILDGDRHGFRIRAGVWLDPCNRVGLEGEYFSLGTANEQYVAFSDATGRPVLARPYFNINPRDEFDAPDPPAREDSQLVSYPDELAGTVSVAATSTLSSAAAHVRINVCCKNWCYPDPCYPCCWGQGNARLDFLVGYRWARLKERLRIFEDLTTLIDEPPGDVLDRFTAYNDFHGCDLAVQWQVRHNRWFLETLGRISLGNNRQTVDIFGNTVFTQPVPAEFEGGLLTQTTNIGRYTRDDFTMIPEIGVTLGCELTPCLTFTVGYTLLYWGRVARPGDQIDRDVNPDYLAPPLDPDSIPARPEFVFDSTDFWAQGLNLGLDYRW
jgi:hypothetical protein